jgi:arginyl-tRNA synthetase
MQTLQECVEGLNLHEHIPPVDPQFPACYPQFNPIDVYRVHLATALSNVTGIEAATIYPALQRTQTQDKGDLVLATPALRVEREKPADLAVKWAKEVCTQLSPLLY